MITSTYVSNAPDAGKEGLCYFGNTLFNLAATIGIATINGYSWGFSKWENQKYFVNKLPVCHGAYKKWVPESNYKGYDVGFLGFDVPDNRDIKGQFGSVKYWKHCEGLVRHYLTMKQLTNVYLKNWVVVQYRAYNELKDNGDYVKLTWDNYYKKALEHFPGLGVMVVTNDVVKAKEQIGLDCNYVHLSPIHDFNLLTMAENLVMANSSFSWWGAYLSGAQTVAPKNWFTNSWKDCDLSEYMLEDWILC